MMKLEFYHFKCLCDIRGLLDVSYCILSHQSSGNWGRQAKQHVSFINFEPLELY